MNPRMSDEELGLALRAVLARVDPVPPEALAAASAALAWRDLDAALAALTSDSLMESSLAAVRGTPPRLLSFTAEQVTIDLEVTAEAGTVRMLGQIAPPQAVDYIVEYAGGTRRGRTDAIGRLSVDGLPLGWIRVVVTTGDEAATAKSRTEWFRV